MFLECPWPSLSVAVQEEGQPGWAVPVLVPALHPPAAEGCRGCCALASAPAAREIKGMAAAVPALEIFWAVLGRGVELEQFWDVQE